jgi:hypothetical protein
VLKDVLSASSAQETMRIGDVSASVRLAVQCRMRGAPQEGCFPRPPRLMLTGLWMLTPRRLQAVSVKHKYAKALELLRSLPGTDTSLEEQETAIADAKVELKRISYVLTSTTAHLCCWALCYHEHALIDGCSVLVLCCRDVVELYSNTLYRGTDEPRAEINDAFSRKSLLK